MLRVIVFCLVLLTGAGVARADAIHDCDYGKDIERHIRGCTALIRRNPHDAVAYYNRGNAYQKKRDYDSAIADYTKAIRIRPNYAHAYYNRGNAYSDKGDYDAAIADYTQESGGGSGPFALRERRPWLSLPAAAALARMSGFFLERKFPGEKRA